MKIVSDLFFVFLFETRIFPDFRRVKLMFRSDYELFKPASCNSEEFLWSIWEIHREILLFSHTRRRKTRRKTWKNHEKSWKNWKRSFFFEGFDLLWKKWDFALFQVFCKISLNFSLRTSKALAFKSRRFARRNCWFFSISCIKQSFYRRY